MGSHLRRAHDELDLATECARPQIREQLESIDEGVLVAVVGNRVHGTPGPSPEEIADLERTLYLLEHQCHEPAATHLQEARKHIQAFRYQLTLD